MPRVEAEGVLGATRPIARGHGAARVGAIDGDTVDRAAPNLPDAVDDPAPLI